MRRSVQESARRCSRGRRPRGRFLATSRSRLVHLSPTSSSRNKMRVLVIVSLLFLPRIVLPPCLRIRPTRLSRR